MRNNAYLALKFRFLPNLLICSVHLINNTSANDLTVLRVKILNYIGCHLIEYFALQVYLR